MNSIDSTNRNKNSDKEMDERKIDEAERDVQMNVRRFESAMEGLANRVEKSSNRVQSTVEMVDRSRQKIMDTRDNVVSSVNARVEAVKPYYRHALSTSGRYANQVKENPRPYLYTAAAILGGYILMRLVRWQRARREVEVISVTDVRVEPGYATRVNALSGGGNRPEYRPSVH